MRPPSPSARASAPVRRARALAALALAHAAAGSGACGQATSSVREQRPEITSSVREQSPEYAGWLAAVGTGREQTKRVCQRGTHDRVTSALCTDEAAAEIRSLEDLYRALGLLDPAHRRVAATTHSLGLSARSVSAVNPRAFVFPDPADYAGPDPYERIAAVAFNRGEQLVELVALDPATYEFTFYLLHFEQRCNRSRCTPEDLLTEKIEHDWTRWTLYADADLEDTPLDCISCHLPFGQGTHKLLLMRQFLDPWMHWGDFRGGDEKSLCFKANATSDWHIESDGLDALLRLEGERGRYAGVPLFELHSAPSGEQFTVFLNDAEHIVRASPYPPGYPYDQLTFATREVLCERMRSGTSPTWNKARAKSVARGLPVPHYAPDVLDPALRASFLADRHGFLRSHADADAVELASSLIDSEAAAAIGFISRDEDSVTDILRQMCVRCHSDSTDPRLQRSRFNAEQLDSIEPETARAIRYRIMLPSDSLQLMPPRAAGSLTPAAIERIDRYLSEHCSDPGGCD